MYVIRVKYEGAGSMKLAKRKLNVFIKEGFELLGVHWHRKFRPKHFTEGGAREYRYDDRTAAYERRKKRVLGHNLPLVWSGESRTLSRIRRVRATSKGVRVSMSVGRLNFHKKGKELRVISRPELTQLANLQKRTLTKRLNSFRDKQTVTIK